MEQYKDYTLKELCSIDITDGTHQTPIYSDDGYIFLSSKNVVSGKIDWDNVMYIPEKLHQELYRRVRPQKNDILLAKNGTTGVAALVDRDVVFDIYVSLALIRPNCNLIIPKYLLYAINSTRTKQYFDSNLKGIGVPNLHLKHIRETPIKVPSISQQENVVGIFDNLYNLINLHTQQLTKLDQLVKSRFIEMFGDPLMNDKGFLSKDGKSLFAFSSGKFLCEEKRKDEGIPVYGGNGIAWHTDDALIDFSTIIIGRVGAYCGNVKIVKEPVWITDNAIYIKEFKTNEFNLDFLYMLMTYLNFSQYADFSGQPKVTQKPLENVQYIIPPIDLQNQFANFVEQTDRLKLEVKKSLEKLETLKKSLMQQYFG